MKNGAATSTGDAIDEPVNTSTTAETQGGDTTTADDGGVDGDTGGADDDANKEVAPAAAEDTLHGDKARASKLG